MAHERFRHRIKCLYFKDIPFDVLLIDLSLV